MKLMAICDVGFYGCNIIEKNEIYETVGEIIDHMVTIKLKNNSEITLSSCLFIQISK